MKVGFIGLGNMGLPMARNLSKAGIDLMVYNRTREKAEVIDTSVASSPAELARQVDVLITMLAHDRALRSILFEKEGAFAVLKPGAIHISMSTVSIDIIRELTKKHKEAGHHFISSPVFGRPDAAENGALVVLAAGDKEKVEGIQELYQHLGKAHHYIGQEPWQANLFKIAGNFWISSMIETMGESFALLRKAKVDHTLFFELLTSIFQSPIYKNYGKKILEESFQPAGFSLIHGLKDVQLIADAAREFSVPMAFVSALKDNYTTAANQGKSDFDWSGLARQIAENAGLK